MKRSRLPAKIEKMVFLRSRRRCCICFGLHRQIGVKRGQIAHLDHDRANNAISNLAYVCLEHHDAYDSTARQSKGLTAREVRAYREELYQAVIPVLERRARIQRGRHRVARGDRLSDLEPRLDAERQAAIQELLGRWGQVRGHTMLAHRLGLPAQTVERILARLAGLGLVRVDREPGTLRNTYTLAASAENRLIDTFVSSLDETVSNDSRYVRRGLVDIDAVLTCKRRAYLVDTLLLKNRASRDLIARRVRALHEARRQLRLPRAKCVILAGITRSTAMASVPLRSFERRGLLVRYIDLGPA